MVRNRTGTPARGGDFFDRHVERKRMWEQLDTDNLLLVAPRRVGKTSLLLKLGEEADAHGFRTIYVGVAKCKTEAAFMREILKSIEKHPRVGSPKLKELAKTAKSLVKRAKKLGPVELDAGAQETWQDIGEELLEALSALEGRWLIMVDELPLVVLALLNAEGGRARTRQFMDWFRDVRLDAAHSETLRWIVCGSIGLDNVTARANMSDTTNDLARVELGAFDPETSHQLLKELAETRGLEFPRKARGQAIARVGWPVPYHLQLLFSELLNLNETLLSAAIDVAMVDAAYARLLRSSGKAYFDWWFQRLAAELDASDAALARAMLRVVAVSEKPVSRDRLAALVATNAGETGSALGAGAPTAGLTAFLLDVLRSDGYLVESAPGAFTFRSNLLRDYWRRWQS